MGRRRLLLPALLVLLASPAVWADLVDEIVAGSDLNDTRLAVGTASYVARGTRTHGRWVSARVFVSQDEIRCDFGDLRRLITPDYLVEFDADAARQIRAGKDPRQFSAYVRRPDIGPISLHLRNQGLFEPGPIADVIRRWRKTKDAVIDVLSVEDNLELRVESEEMQIKGEYVVAPQQGYCVLSATEWAMKAPSLPYREAKTEFQQTTNDAFVAKSGKTTRRIRMQPNAPWKVNDEIEFRLKEVTLLPPDPSHFKLEGLGLPKGIRLQDRTRNKEYIYGQDPVSEDDIVPPPVYGSDQQPWVGRALLCLILGLSVVAIIYFYRRRQ